MPARISVPTSLLVAVLATAGTAAAEVYPSRPITIIVPTPAGGSPDTLARLLGEHMKTTLGQPIVVENVSGAGGTIGVARVVRAAPDGHTLSIGHLTTHVFSSASYSVQYDVLNDLEPVTLLVTAPMVIVARRSLAANNLKELVGWLKSNPDAGTWGTSGIGACGIYFQHHSEVRLRFVRYRGAAPIVQDLLGGQIDLSCLEGSNVAEYIGSGQIKTYAVTARTRWARAPDIPTVDEAGLPGLHMAFWHGLWVPKGTPKHVIARLSDAVRQALGHAAVRARLADLGQEIFPRDQQTPDALRNHHKSETQKWWPIIKAADIKKAE